MSWAEIYEDAETVLERVANLVGQLRHLPPDIPLIMAGDCAFAALIACLGWSWAARRSRAARSTLAELEREAAELRADYEAEIRWRTASEKYYSRMRSPADAASAPPELPGEVAVERSQLEGAAFRARAAPRGSTPSEPGQKLKACASARQVAALNPQ